MVIGTSGIGLIGSRCSTAGAFCFTWWWWGGVVIGTSGIGLEAVGVNVGVGFPP